MLAPVLDAGVSFISIAFNSNSNSFLGSGLEVGMADFSTKVKPPASPLPASHFTRVCGSLNRPPGDVLFTSSTITVCLPESCPENVCPLDAELCPPP